jgi:hypothetical protein
MLKDLHLIVQRWRIALWPIISIIQRCVILFAFSMVVVKIAYFIVALEIRIISDNNE